jgi:DNA-binding NtrC family response regulator
MSFRPGLEFGGALRVALADDEIVIRRVTEQMLASMGAVVSVVPDGSALSELLATDRFDLVVTDVDMPGCRGTDVLFERRNLGDLTPFVVITGNPYVVDVAVGRHPAAVVLAKPFSLVALEDAMTDVIIAGRHLAWEMARPIALAR